MLWEHCAECYVTPSGEAGPLSSSYGVLAFLLSPFSKFYSCSVNCPPGEALWGRHSIVAVPPPPPPPPVSAVFRFVSKLLHAGEALP